MIRNSQNKGAALLEMVFYISLFVIFSIVIIDSLLTMSRSFKETNIMAALLNGSTIMEKITRDVKQASDITVVSSTDLRLSTTDEAGTPKTEEFILSGDNIQFLENDDVTGNLNSGSVIVTALSFTSISTTVGEGVKISFTLRAAEDSQNRTYDFHNTAILRGNY